MYSAITLWFLLFIFLVKNKDAIGHLCIPSFVKHWLNSLVCFLNWVFSLCKNSLYILDTSLLTGMCIRNIFSQVVACLFSFIEVSFEEQTVFTCDEIQLVHFCFYDFCFLCSIKQFLPTRRSQRFISYTWLVKFYNRSWNQVV